MKTITLSNRDQKSYRVSGRASLLTELMDQGVDLPYGCKYGGCITCAAKLVEGSVDQRAQVALNNRQIKNGYVINSRHTTLISDAAALDMIVF